MRLRWIITAAHCIVGRSEINVHIGAKANGVFKTKFRIDSPNLHIHPDYDNSKHINDIGLYFKLYFQMTTMQIILFFPKFSDFFKVFFQNFL